MVGSRSTMLTIRISASALCVAQMACYTLRPATGIATPSLESVIAVDINDAGRAAMGGVMVPEIGQIEGRLTAIDENEYAIAITAVRLLRGGEQVWRGELVRIKKDYVTRVYEKHFSAGRTIMASVAGASVIAYVAAKGLVGAGLGDMRVPSDTGRGDMRRRPKRP